MTDGPHWARRLLARIERAAVRVRATIRRWRRAVQARLPAPAGPPPGTPFEEATWGPSEALARAALLAAFTVGGGLALGRPDAVVLGVPLVLGTLLALGGPAPGPGPVTTAVASRLVEQGSVVPVETTLGPSPGAQLVAVRLPRGRDALGQTVTAVPPDLGVSRSFTSARRGLDWGDVAVARPDVLAAGPDGLLVFGPARARERRALVLPAVEVTLPGPAPPRPASTVGAHRTRRPGDGSELLDIREFAPGDRIRRIDWRVTARRDRVHVRRTAVDADADVVLCLDTRLEVGPDAALWAPPPDEPGATRRRGGSLDVTVRAAVSLAAAHLRHGDRVAVADLAHPRASVRAAAGRRQLTRIRLRLARAVTERTSSRIGIRATALPTGAVVFVISPWLDDSIAELAASVHRRGAQVVALDVLPWPLTPDVKRPGGREALRIVLAERHERLSALRRAGLPVLRWEPAALGHVLRATARARERRRR